MLGVAGQACASPAVPDSGRRDAGLAAFDAGDAARRRPDAHDAGPGGGRDAYAAEGAAHTVDAGHDGYAVDAGHDAHTDDAEAVDARYDAPPPDVCPPLVNTASPGNPYTRVTGTIQVDDFGEGTMVSVDSTQFSSIWSHPGDPQLPWPSGYDQNVLIPLPTSQYLSAAFTVPVGYFDAAPPTLYGELSIQETGITGPISMTISTSCGDFSPSNLPGSTVVPGCYLNLGTAESGEIEWRSTDSCALQSGHSYYYNIINADISSLTPHGGGSATPALTRCADNILGLFDTCTDPILNGPGSWSSYHP
jgi:hypothetical protein